MNIKSILRLGKAALLGSCALLVAAAQASAAETAAASSSSFDLSACGIGPAAPGQFSNLAIFTLNAGNGDTDILSGNAQVQGAVAVAGSGKISLSNFSQIKGNLSYKTNGTLTKGSTTNITGSIYKNSSTDSLLNAGASAALFVSSFANSLNASSGYPTTINSNSSLSLNSSGLAVLKLTDFKLSNNATLTLQGTASSFYVINVQKDFSLTNAYVKLSGGLTWDHVLFNVRGSSGLTTISGTSEFNGILLAANRTVTLKDNSKLIGAVVANTVNLSGNSIVRCPTVSP